MAGTIVLIFLALCSLGMTAYFGYITWKSIVSYWWPHTTGVIISNQLVGRGHAKGVPMYGTRISYSYTVNGEVLTGRKMDFMQSDNAKIVKMFTSGKYYANQQVKVYYNPEKPSEAILERGVKLKYIWPFFCGMLFPAVVILAYIYGRD